jgi:hypothetical protein
MLSRLSQWAVAAAVAAVVIAAAARPAGGVGAQRAPVGVINITSRQLSDRRIDEGPRGRGTGDVEVVWDALYNRRVTPHAIGHAQLACTRLTASSQSCSATYFLPKGKLVVEGVIGSRLLYQSPVVGGTGVYTGARGTLLVTRAAEHPVHEILVFELVG